MQSYIIMAKDLASCMNEINARIQHMGISPFDIVSPDSSTPSIGIAEVKAFIKRLSLLPQHGTKTAGVIAEAGTLTTEAQQALLKTLEEPPSHTVIFLGVTHSTQLLPTVVSRCQIIALSDLTPRDEKEYATISREINTLLTASLGQRLSLLQSVGKTREEYETWIDQAIAYLRMEMLRMGASLPNEERAKQKITLLRSLLTAKEYRSNNVNTLLLLEHALLTVG